MLNTWCIHRLRFRELKIFCQTSQTWNTEICMQSKSRLMPMKEILEQKLTFQRSFHRMSISPGCRGIVVIAYAYRTEDPRFVSRQGVRFLGTYTLRCCCHNLICIVVVCTWDKMKRLNFLMECQSRFSLPNFRHIFWWMPFIKIFQRRGVWRDGKNIFDRSRKKNFFFQQKRNLETLNLFFFVPILFSFFTN
jgi:hypothetical protein